MSVELMENPDKLSDFPFETETKEEKNMSSVFEKASLNNLRSEEEIREYFKSPEIRKSNEIIFQSVCNTKQISLARQLALDVLEEKKVVPIEKIEELESLVGEIILDTSHSLEQKIKNPYFIVRMFNLNYPDKFGFEIINKDYLEFKEWGILTSPEEIVEQYGKIGGGTHAGTILKKNYIEGLGGKAKYIAVNDEKGEKRWTAFQFRIEK